MPFSFARDDTNLDGTLFDFLIKVRDLSVGPHFPSVAVQDKGWHCMRIWRFDPNKPPVVADITKLKGCLTKRKPHAVKGLSVARAVQLYKMTGQTCGVLNLVILPCT